jgi:uncharacterized membrane protein YesL
VLPVVRTLGDWWREMLTLGMICFAWLLLSMTVIGGPPAGAALYAAARGTVLHQHIDLRLFTTALRQYFLRSWILGLVGLFGIVVWWLDLTLYVNLVGDSGAIAWAGRVIVFYAGVIWLHTLSYAWSLMVCRDDLRLLHLLRNGLILSLRYPANTITTSIVAGVILLGAMYAPPLIGLVLPALIALLGLHNLYLLAPELVPDDIEVLRVVS